MLYLIYFLSCIFCRISHTHKLLFQASSQSSSSTHICCIFIYVSGSDENENINILCFLFHCLIDFLALLKILVHRYVFIFLFFFFFPATFILISISSLSKYCLKYLKWWQHFVFYFLVPALSSLLALEIFLPKIFTKFTHDIQKSFI